MNESAGLLFLPAQPPPPLPPRVNSFPLSMVLSVWNYHALFESRAVKVGNAISNIQTIVILILQILLRLNTCSNYEAETSSLVSVLPQFQLGSSPETVTVIFL